MLTKICPHCNSEVERIPKTGFSKFLGRLMEVQRYQCQNTGCKWEKLVFPELNQKYVFKLLLPYLFTLGVPLLIIIVFLIFTAPRPSEQLFPQATPPSLNKEPVIEKPSS